MANPRKRVPENAPGDFFVDSTCIDCDTCRQVAPQVFGEAPGTSFVKAQPAAASDRRVALQALLACPTGSIGCLGDDDVKAVADDFPLPVEGPVYYCGYNSPKSFGGNSYFVRHPDGTILVHQLGAHRLPLTLEGEESPHGEELSGNLYLTQGNVCFTLPFIWFSRSSSSGGTPCLRCRSGPGSTWPSSP